jgi:hypothetical protein
VAEGGRTSARTKRVRGSRRDAELLVGPMQLMRFDGRQRVLFGDIIG